MKVISVAEDANPFSGRIVAYKTTSSYFGIPINQFAVGDVFFGYVEQMNAPWINGERGYTLMQILNPRGIATSCALIPLKLNGANFSMRMATIEEAETIRKALEVGQVTLGYATKNEAARFLDRHITYLYAERTHLQ